MSDSDMKLLPEQSGQKTPAVSEEAMKTHTGTTKIMLRGEGGKFQKKPKSKPKSEEIVRYMRELLNKAEAGPDGRFTRGDKTRFRRMFDNIFSIAAADPMQPVKDKFGNILIDDETGRPLTYFDAKCAMASTQAFKELMLRAYGMPSKSDEELDALKQEGVKIVVIAPPEMMNKEIVEEKPKEKLVPSFIDADIVENK